MRYGRVTVASEKDGQMSETLINHRNLRNPLLCPDYFCLIPEQSCLKEERVAYRFWRLDSGLMALGYDQLQFQNQSDLEVKSESNAIVR